MSIPRPALARQDFLELHRRSDLRPALYMAAVFAAITATAAAVAWRPSPWLLVPAVFVVGALQHHLSVIHHESVHYLLFRNRRANELAGRAAAWPIFFTMRYRQVHLKHHRSLGHDDDPDLASYVNYPNDLGYVMRDLLLHVTGLAAARQFLRLALSRGGERPRVDFDRELAGVAITQLLIVALFALFAHWSLYGLLWIVPLVSVAKPLAHFRAVVEHARVRAPGPGSAHDGREDAEDAGRYRTVLSSPLEAFFFAPMNFNYHAEHHFYMGVPYHRLPRCHAILSGRPEYRQQVEIERGYLRFLFGTLIRGRTAAAALVAPPPPARWR